MKTKQKQAANNDGNVHEGSKCSKLWLETHRNVDRRQNVPKVSSTPIKLEISDHLHHGKNQERNKGKLE